MFPGPGCCSCWHLMGPSAHGRWASLPGSSVHGVLQARVLEWGAIAFSIPVLATMNLIKSKTGQDTCLLGIYHPIGEQTPGGRWVLGCPTPMGRGSHEVPTGAAPRSREHAAPSLSQGEVPRTCPLGWVALWEEQQGTQSLAKCRSKAPASLHLSGCWANS